MATARTAAARVGSTARGAYEAGGAAAEEEAADSPEEGQQRDEDGGGRGAHAAASAFSSWSAELLGSGSVRLAQVAEPVDVGGAAVAVDLEHDGQADADLGGGDGDGEEGEGLARRGACRAATRRRRRG
ncbi:hypothetical protein GCM10020000_44700 [Streptomyces olivoverticillatus]